MSCCYHTFVWHLMRRDLGPCWNTFDYKAQLYRRRTANDNSTIPIRIINSDHKLFHTSYQMQTLTIERSHVPDNIKWHIFVFNVMYHFNYYMYMPQSTFDSCIKYKFCRRTTHSKTVTALVRRQCSPVSRTRKSASTVRVRVRAHFITAASVESKI